VPLNVVILVDFFTDFFDHPVVVGATLLTSLDQLIPEQFPNVIVIRFLFELELSDVLEKLEEAEREPGSEFVNSGVDLLLLDSFHLVILIVSV